MGPEKQNYGKTYMGIARGFLIVPDGADRRGLAQGQGRRPRRRRAGGPRSRPRPAGRMTENRAAPRLSGHAERLRSWGETSDASVANVTQRPLSAMPARVACRRRNARQFADATDVADEVTRTRPRVASGAVHGHRGPPRRRRLRAGRRPRPAGSRGLRGLARLLHERRRGRRRCPTDPLELAGRASASSGGRGDRRATRGSPSSTSPTARSPTTWRCASSWSRDPHLPSRCGPGPRPHGRSSTPRQPHTHGPPGGGHGRP